MAERQIAPSNIAREAVLVANTGSFIFQQLTKDAEVRAIADAHTADQILAWFVAQPPEPGDVRDLVLRYMYLVAMAFKSPEEIALYLSRIPIANLEWGPEIAAIIANKSIPLKTVQIYATQPTPWLTVQDKTTAAAPLTPGPRQAPTVRILT